MRKWLPLGAVCLGTFMLLVDVSIVNVALPSMSLDLKATYASLQWVIDAYALVLAALLLGVGALADVLGHRRSYLVGIAIFAVASFGCGIAPSAEVLIVARFVQGFGGAIMFATTFALLNGAYTGRDRGTAYAMWGAISGAATALGPVVGGVLTEYANWRWTFFVNLPISVAALALTIAVIRPDLEVRKRAIDFTGTIVFSIAAGSLTYGLIRTSEQSWTSTWVVTCLLVAIVGFIAFVVVEQRSDHPMLDLALFGNPAFVGYMIACLLVNLSAFSAFVNLALWLQSVQHLSPLEAGLATMPVSASIFTASLVGRKLHQAHPGLMISGGLALVGVGQLLSGSLLTGDSGWAVLIAGFVILGTGVGLSLPAVSAAVMGTVPIARGGMAAGASSTARQLGFAIGVAVLGTLFTTRAESYFSHHGSSTAASQARELAAGHTQQVLSSVPVGSRESLKLLFHGAAASGVASGLILSGVLAFIGAVAVFALTRPRFNRVPAIAARTETAGATT